MNIIVWEKKIKTNSELESVWEDGDWEVSAYERVETYKLLNVLGELTICMDDQNHLLIRIA